MQTILNMSQLDVRVLLPVLFGCVFAATAFVLRMICVQSLLLRCATSLPK